MENLKRLRACRTLGLCINYSSEKDDETVREGIALAEELDGLKKDPNHSTYLQIRPEMDILGRKHECTLPDIDHPLIEITEKDASDRGYDECEAYHFTPFIWQDGKIDICAYHGGESDFNLGDLHAATFKEIMDAAPKSVRVTDNCQACCKLNEMNRLIQRKKNVEDMYFL
ncbi:MAG: hypothetical protein HGA31_02830 [Candidatus Moranbacteria bacterium]|nr:hypothetical protein [Candidatus Moranbacteria bacterium]